MVMLRALTTALWFIIRYRFRKLKSLSDVGHFCYSSHVLKLSRKYVKYIYRFRKNYLDITLLNICLDNYLCPTFLRYKFSWKRLQNSESYRRLKHLFLQEEIIFKTAERKKIIRELH